MPPARGVGYDRGVGMRQALTRWVSRVGAPGFVLRAKAAVRLPVISILTYHHIAEPVDGDGFDPDVADATPSQFQSQMELISRYCTAISIDELIAALAGEPLPPNPVLITFDDGYASNIEVAAPILERLRLPATFFVATRFVDERRLFWWEAIAQILELGRRQGKHEIDLTYPAPTRVSLRKPHTRSALLRLVKGTADLDVDRFVTELAAAAGVDWTLAHQRDLADLRIMTWKQVRQLAAAGLDVESHGHAHRVLATMSVDDLRVDLQLSKSLLETQLGRPQRAIAYPVGHPIVQNPALRSAVVAAGYRLGFTNGTGVNRVWEGIDPFDIKRLATDRAMSPPTLLAQLAFPQLAHTRELR